MAINYAISPDAIRLEIARLQGANALMRAANKALAKGDHAALNDMWDFRQSTPMNCRRTAVFRRRRSAITRE